MNLNILSKKREVWIHIIVWMIILLLPYILSSADQNYEIGKIPGHFFTIAGVIHVGIFYINAFVLYPKLANGWRWWLYIPASIVLIIFSFNLKYLIITKWFPETFSSGYAQFIFAPSVFVFFASVIYRRVIDSINTERERKEKQAQQLTAELKFLRSQINPHFLFNVLTNLVSLARQKSDKMENALIRLSDLMRYMLYETKGSKVQLRKEIEYLSSYIELQKLRFEDAVKIEFTVRTDENADNLTIEPMLLIPFVENAFKYGTGWIEEPYIKISIKIESNQLLFAVENRYDAQHDRQKDDSSGIGLTNAISRLNLLYPKSHKLLVNQNERIFRVTLKLTLI